MRKTLRIILGVLIVGVVLHAADLATRDCRVAPYVHENCLWIWVRIHLGLPASRLLRMVVLECAGVALTAALFLTIRFVFPFRRSKAGVPEPSAPVDPQGPQG